jgi:SAM-dependent methyltransferase
MSFSADWLALREPADRAARDADLVARLGAWAAARPGLRVTDIGCGTGSTLRALAAALPGARWRLVDHDPALLTLAAAEAARLGATAQTVALDLAADPGAAVADGAQLVTASAFFDLAGADWIAAFAAAAARAGCGVYAALNYDGRESWTPPHPEDGAVMAAFLRDMRRDKGLGPALGAEAGAFLAERLRAEGYTVTTASSPWKLAAPADLALMAALSGGIADASGASADWRAARAAAQSAEVGHIDVLALPA